MTMDVADALDDEELAQDFTIVRTTGHFGEGGWIGDAPVNIPASGIVGSLSGKDIMALPEGDRVKGNAVFHSRTEMKIAGQDNGGNKWISDKILWHGDLYKLATVADYSDYGYYRAIGLREDGV
jgi:hypothetical protein